MGKMIPASDLVTTLFEVARKFLLMQYPYEFEVRVLA
jgi:hypothetical protein